MKDNKIKKSIKIILSITVVIIIIILLDVIVPNQKTNQIKEIQLTQLQANSHRQMMGYIIKTSEGRCS